jgi:mono/diheme cytochrome c family protein
MEGFIMIWLEHLLSPGRHRALSIAQRAFLLPELLCFLALAWHLGANLLRGAQPPSEGAAQSSLAGTRDRPPTRKSAAASHYRTYCARCHGEDYAGTTWRQGGGRIPDFTTGTWQKSRSDAQLLVSILEGKGTAMPAFADKLSEEQSRDLVLLIRRANATQPAPLAPAPTNFARRYAALRQELEELRKQFRELDGAPRKAKLP